MAALCSLGLSTGCPAPEGPAGATATPEVVTTAPTDVVATASTAPAATAAPVQPAPRAAAAPAGTPCGPLDCKLFDSPADAFAAVLAESPQVLAIGEAHAQAGAPAVASATKRFTETMLPLAKGRASDIVLELMIADGSCGQDEKKVAQVQKPVVQQQKKENKNEFVVLGDAAKAIEIRPHVLTPKCEDYREVVAAGPDGVIQMLTMIADLTYVMVDKILGRNVRIDAGDKLVLAYGGAIHNDLVPREGREKWSFGPRLAKLTNNRYVALDLIVPEFIKDNESWTSLPWYPHFDPKAHPDKTTLYRVADKSYVIIFPASG